MHRRQFIRDSALAGAGLTFGAKLLAAEGKNMPQRVLGRTGEKLSQLGFGGILVRNEMQEVANDMVARAWSRGINYYDVAPTYGDAEEKLGPALKPYRKEAFLACKTAKRDAEGARAELEASLKKLKTDYFDLYQLHHITSKEDVERAFGPGGAMETFINAREEGLVRYLGFSAHSEWAALEAMKRFDFDSILFPVNFVCWFQGDFGPAVLEEAKKTDKGILALKGHAFKRRLEGETIPYDKIWYHPIPENADRMAELAFKFTYSQGITSAIPPGQPLFWPRAFEIAAGVQPITETELAELKKMAKDEPPIFSA